MDMLDDMDDEESYEGGSSKTGRINKGRWKKEEVGLRLSSPAFLLDRCHPEVFQWTPGNRLTRRKA